MLSGLSLLHVSLWHPFAPAAAAACCSISSSALYSTLKQYSNSCVPPSSSCGTMQGSLKPFSAAAGSPTASTSRTRLVVANAADRSYSGRPKGSPQVKLPKTMLHIQGIGKSYAKALQEKGIKSAEQLGEKIINRLQSVDGLITDAPAVKLLQEYGVKRQDCAQRIIRHLTSLYAPELLSQLQAADAAADTAVRPNITFCVEGNISAGKSTFLGYITQGHEELEHELGVVHEPVEEWQRVPTVQGDTLNLLDKFYQDPQKYAYTFQNYVFMSRVLQERNSANMNKPVRVMERSVFSDRMVFVRAVRESGWMGDVELAVYDSWFNPILQQSPHLRPHGFIYLKCDPATCMDRLKLRGRHEEDTISIDYLEGLHAKHEDWLGAGQLAHNVHDRLGGRRNRRSTGSSGLLVPDQLRSSLYYLDKDGRGAPPDMHETLHLVPALVLDCNRDVLNDRDARQDVQEKVLNYISFMREHTAWHQQQKDSSMKLKQAMGLGSSELLVWSRGAQPGAPQGPQKQAVDTIREALGDVSEVKIIANTSGTLANGDGNGDSRAASGSLEVLQAAASAAARQQQQQALMASV